MEHFNHFHFLEYSFPNDMYIYWTLMIVLYPYITGLVAGAFIVSSLYHVFGKEELKPVAKFSLLMAFGFLLFASVPLLNHLGHPERAFNVMITPNFTSAISGFGFIYSTYAILLMLEIWFVFRKDIILYSQKTTGFLKFFYTTLTLGNFNVSDEAMKVDHKVVTILAAIGIPMACMLHGYVGFLFGAVKANPWWSTPLMPVIFLLSAAVSGIAMLILLYIIASKFMKIDIHEECIRSLNKYLWAFLIADVTLEMLEILVLFYESGEEWEVIHYLLANELFYSFIIFQVFICSIIPLIALGIVNILTLSFRVTLFTSLFSSLLLIFQVFLMRWNVVIGGQHFSKSFIGFKEYHPLFFEKEGILATIIIFICPLIVIYILNRLFPNLKDNEEF
ncbi:MAG: polysulfide reductase NrfD [Nitrospinae bacterium]|nr:polysulfide reductase NrfD [Nitrospinota bacterium]